MVGISHHLMGYVIFVRLSLAGGSSVGYTLGGEEVRSYQSRGIMDGGRGKNRRYRRHHHNHGATETWLRLEKPAPLGLGTTTGSLKGSFLLKPDGIRLDWVHLISLRPQTGYDSQCQTLTTPSAQIDETHGGSK
ncbi:hypothetical protein BDV59DRAFT_29082 [Aspergillus ambiguus]|uniref:uncharacterized protein n=1 Tax=Aspergillus ambiguus TaxID=176160 RepID=UPI003CCD8BB2